MDAVDAGFDDRALALLLDRGVHLAAGLFDHLFDARRVDTAVRNELFQGDTRHFAAHRLKAGEGDGLRRIVDNQVHAGQGFDGPDIAALRGR